MEYSFDIDKWYLVNELVYGKLEKGRVLGTEKEIQWFDNESDWLTALNELGIEVDDELI